MSGSNCRSFPKGKKSFADGGFADYQPAAGISGSAFAPDRAPSVNPPTAMDSAGYAPNQMPSANYPPTSVPSAGLGGGFRRRARAGGPVMGRGAIGAPAPQYGFNPGGSGFREVARPIGMADGGRVKKPPKPKTVVKTGPGVKGNAKGNVVRAFADGGCVMNKRDMQKKGC